MTNDLITTREVEGEAIVDARHVHEFVESKERFSKWWDRMLSYGFVEGVDYTPYQKVHPQNKQEIEDYAMKIDMAKEISMIQRNEKGKEARLYFIEVEKRMKSQVVLHSYMIEDPVKRAEKWIEEYKEKELLMLKVEEQQPLVTFAEKCIKTNDSILIREMSKIITEQGIVNIGEKKLYQKLREWGLILKGKTEPSQRAMNSGYFEVTQRVIKTPYGERLESTTKVLPKGQVYIVERLDKEVNQAN